MQYTTISEEKAALRHRVRVHQAALTPEERRLSDRALFTRFLALEEVKRACTVMLYLGMGAEPDTGVLISALLAQGKRVALPRCLPERGMQAQQVVQDTVYVRHPYGMLEPGEDCPVLPPKALDLILVPGLSFTPDGRRLGQGGGYYDRFLPRSGAVTAALCRGVLLCETIPTEPHDFTVGLVVTEDSLYRIR